MHAEMVSSLTWVQIGGSRPWASWTPPEGRASACKIPTPRTLGGWDGPVRTGQSVGYWGLVVVLGVRDVLAPLSVSFGQREMGHEMVGCGAVPVPLVARRGDHIAGADREDGPAAGLHAPFAFGHVERLADRMRMPGAAGPRGEVHGSDGHR